MTTKLFWPSSESLDVPKCAVFVPRERNVINRKVVRDSLLKRNEAELFLKILMTSDDGIERISHYEPNCRRKIPSSRVSTVLPPVKVMGRCEGVEAARRVTNMLVHRARTELH